jgi:hypothetical protein
LFEWDDHGRDQGHDHGGSGRFQPPAVRTGGAGAPGDVPEDGREDRHGDRDVAEVGEDFGDAVRADQGAAEAFVRAGEGAVGGDLPGDQDEEEGREAEEEGRPPRNRGGSSEAAVQIGMPRAPGGLGRATVRSVRRSGAGSSGCVREGTTRAKLGRPRPGVTHSPLWAGCISHLE